MQYESKQPLDKTWRWVNPQRASAQSGTVHTLRVIVIGDATEATVAARRDAERVEAKRPRTASLPSAYDCVRVPAALAADTPDWRTVSDRDCTELPHGCTDAG